MDGMELLELESRQCFNFLWEQVNSNPESPSYGLIVDSTNQPEVASIASVGLDLVLSP